MEALDLFPKLNKDKEPEFKDGDGDDEGGKFVVVNIHPAENGYILTVAAIDDEWQEVYLDKKELLKRIGEIL